MKQGLIKYTPGWWSLGRSIPGFSGNVDKSCFCRSLKRQNHTAIILAIKYNQRQAYFLMNFLPMYLLPTSIQTHTIQTNLFMGDNIGGLLFPKKHSHQHFRKVICPWVRGSCRLTLALTMGSQNCIKEIVNNNKVEEDLNLGKFCVGAEELEGVNEEWI